ncbi:hypothetical protein MYSTI_04091 [Myxococcus stipitatus DSM 14675]|uniref:Uncharacterized protein n=1 Tax=Myxococcus stipitatus (strain DSM 14675 / JCM 12634 / Mx s8) TaxID=1278073 RepID=L7UCS3_MYXSD|nr:hypothetical protein [Myxococcus stipitatus]AGC45392.1 hypothetical protein MYSTI_04091 [Myxococcus stipitatus DSM 14675]
MADGPPHVGTRWTWPRSLVLALGLGILLSLPSLRVGLMLDDLMHRMVINGSTRQLGDWGPLSLYEFVGGPGSMPERLRESGLLPWWASDSLLVRFFRPIPSALLSLDAWLFRDAALPAHLHSLAWFVALVVLVGWLHQRLLPTPVATLATVLYAVAGAHVLPVAWLAARHPLVSALLGLLALAAHLRAREDAWKPGRVLAPVALAGALLSGEAAVGAVLLLGSYEVFGRRESWQRRSRHLAPYLVLSLVYVVFYVSQGYGARGSNGYLNPIAAPWSFLGVFIQRAFILMSELVLATPSDFTSSAPALLPVIATVGAIATFGAWRMTRLLQPWLSEREQDALRWLIPGGILATLPGAVGVVGGRVLMVPLVAGSALMSVLILRGWQAAREPARLRVPALILRSAVVVLVLGHFGLSPLFRVGMALALGHVANEQWRVAREAPPCDGTLVLVVSSDPSVSQYVPAAMSLTGRAPRGFRLLSGAPHDHVLERVSPEAIDLVVQASPRKQGFWEVVNRESAPPAGTKLKLGDLQVSVLESSESGFMRARFDFGHVLESGDFCFVTWSDNGLKRIELPPPGQHLALPHSRGPAGL